MSNRAAQILRLVGDDLFSSFRGSYVTHQFTYFAKLAGLHGFRLHSCRHTFATNLVELGVDVHTIAKLVGHSDIKTTIRYAKVSEGVKRKAIEKMNVLTSDGDKMVTFGKLTASQ